MYCSSGSSVVLDFEQNFGYSIFINGGEVFLDFVHSAEYKTPKRAKVRWRKLLPGCVEYTLCRGKKRPNNVFCNISYKTQAILAKFGAPLPRINLLQNDVNVFHLTWAMSIYTTLWNLKCSLRTYCVPYCYQLLPKETPEFIPLQL